MSEKKWSAQEYIQEGLLALVPVYENEQTGTRLYTCQGEHLDARSVHWLLKMLAASYWIELARLRRHCSRLLGLRHNISLPLDAALVLLPVKARQAAAQGEVTVGYVNLLQVQEILPSASSPISPPLAPAGSLSLIIFQNGLQLGTFNTPETLRERLRQGNQVRQEFLRCKISSASYPGLRLEDVLRLLPPCDCALKDFFLRSFHKEGLYEK